MTRLFMSGTDLGGIKHNIMGAAGAEDGDAGAEGLDAPRWKETKGK